MKTMYILLALVAGTISFDAGASDDVSQAEIRQLVNKGEILSLQVIMARFPEKEYGKLLDLEMEREDGSIVYEFEFLRADGLIIEVEVDARNGEILEQEIED